MANLLTWHKTERGYFGTPKRGQDWYFIAENATYWCSHDPQGNGQLSHRNFEDRLREGKRQCEEHANSCNQ